MVNMEIKDFTNLESETNFDVELGFDFGFPEDSPKGFSVNFRINLKNKDESLSIMLLAVAIFDSKENVTEEFKKSNLVRLNSPAIAFPFVRSFINTLTTNAGIPPIILPSFNFAKLKSASELEENKHAPLAAAE